MAVAVSLALSFSGCVCGPVARSGDVSFLWSFGGKSCAMLPDIATVSIQIPRQTLMNNGVYSCTTGGADGIKLLSFAPGTYSYTAQAKNQNGDTLYESAGTFQVNGDIAVALDMTPAPNAPSYAYVTWTLPQFGNIANPSCADARVSAMYITLNGQAMGTVFNCADGQTANGILIPNLTAGTYTIDLAAATVSGANAFYYYRKTSTLTVVPGGTAASYSLDWFVGGTAFKWTLVQGGVTRTCADLGLDHGYLNLDLKDSQGNYVWNGSYTPVDCVKNGSSQGLFMPDLNTSNLKYLYPGTYQVSMFVIANGVTLRTSQSNPPTITVVSGQFPQLANNSPIFELNSQN